MRHRSVFKVFTRQGKDRYDYFTIRLSIPWIEHVKEKDEFDEEFTRSQLMAATGYLYYRSDYLWTFHVSILGFGVHAVRQWGY